MDANQREFGLHPFTPAKAVSFIFEIILITENHEFDSRKFASIRGFDYRS